MDTAVRLMTMFIVVVVLMPGAAFPQVPADQKARKPIPGYSYGTEAIAKSPMSDAEFKLLKQTLLFTDEDVQALRMASTVLNGQEEAILDVWYGFVGANPHLAYYFGGRTGEPDPAYLNAVRLRFGQWIRDTTTANFDRAWLDYQYEVGLRHTRQKKNKTDGVKSASTVIHMRYLVAFIVPLTLTMRPFLAKGGHTVEEVERMHQAWLKAVTLTAVLWSQPYVSASEF